GDPCRGRRWTAKRQQIGRSANGAHHRQGRPHSQDRRHDRTRIVSVSASSRKVGTGFPPSRSPLRRAKEGRKRSCAGKISGTKFLDAGAPFGAPLFWKVGQA